MKYLKMFLKSFFILTALAVVGLYLSFRSLSHYEIQTYKPFPFPPKEQLDDRFALFQTKFGQIGIEWNTYDNRTINEPPYKLTFSLLNSIKNPITFDYVLIDKIEIISDRNNAYEMLPKYEAPTNQNKNIYGERSYNLPLKLDIVDHYHTLEPAFNFDFKGGEKIKTRIYLRFKPKNGKMIPEILDIDWRPITVDAWAPIV